MTAITSAVLFRSLSKGGFPVMAEITRILAANIPRQFFFVIATAASTRCSKFSTN